MSSQLVETPTHPVAVFAERLDTRLDELAETPLLSMTPAEQRQGLVTITRDQAKLAGLKFRLLAHADATGACLEAGAANAAGFMKVETQQSRRDARSDLDLSHRLESLPLLLAGMVTGVVNVAQARAVVKSLDRLPSSGEFAVSIDQRARAEAHLVGLCSTYDAAEVAVLGRRIFEVVAPEAAEAYDGKMLAAEEAKAARKVSFEMWTDGQGITHGRFRLPTAARRDAAQGHLGADQPSSSRHHEGQRDRSRPAHAGAPRDRVHPGRRGDRGALAAHLRWRRRHRGGHDDPRAAAGRPRRCRRVHPGHRRAH